MFFCEQKVEIVSDKLGFLTEVISKHSVEGPTWFLLSVYNKMQEEGVKKELSKEQSGLEDLENSQPISIRESGAGWMNMFWREHQGCGWTTAC